MSPWPAETHHAAVAGPATIPQTTEAPYSGRAVKRRRTSHPVVSPRQDIADQDAVDKAVTQCELYSGNDQYSCFPTQNTTINQGQWISFVWNSKRPELTQQNRVNLYLYRADSGALLYSETNHINDPYQAGVVRAQANDTWWGTDGPNYSGQHTTYPFYWVITPASRGLDGSQHTQSRFSAVQTTYPVSVLAAMSSSSAAAASSSSAAAASASASRSLSGSTPGSSTSSSAGAGVQGGSSNSFPHWAIAVIVVLGFLAIAALCILTFLILRRSRQRQFDSNRGSMGSSSPMMAHADTAGGPHSGSPLLAGAAVASSHGHGKDESAADQERGRAASLHDGASTISRANSTGDGPFSGADAAIMADAFRKALRKPDFAERPVEEGDSPSDHAEQKEELINRELAEEGRDIRSVSSSRGVKVESPSNEGSH